MHLILGNGQLGSALRRALALQGEKAEWYPKRYQEASLNIPFGQELLDLRETTVWNCIGAGSVEAARQNFDQTLSVHVALPYYLMTQLHESCRLVLFSSDYGWEPELSEYGLQKAMMEQLCQQHHRERTACLRVTSLYGPYRPLSSFPGKLLRNFQTKQTVYLPTNHVTPTPVDWLATRLAVEWQGYIDRRPHDICPQGTVSVLDWGRMILPPDWDVLSKGDDPSRPTACSLEDLHNDEDWETLWNLYKNSTLEAVHMRLKDLSMSTSKVTPALFNGT